MFLHALRWKHATQLRHRQLAAADRVGDDPGRAAHLGPQREDVADGAGATFAASVAAMPKPSSHRASAGTGILRRAESSITIELA